MELSTCPFCGERAEVLEGAKIRTVQCVNQCAMMSASDRVEDLVDTWNDRVFSHPDTITTNLFNAMGEVIAAVRLVVEGTAVSIGSTPLRMGNLRSALERYDAVAEKSRIDK